MYTTNNILFKSVLLEKQSVENSLKHLVFELLNDCSLYYSKDMFMFPSVMFMKDKKIFCQIQIYEDVVYFNYNLILHYFPKTETNNNNLKAIIIKIIRLCLSRPQLLIFEAHRQTDWNPNVEYGREQFTPINMQLLKRRIGIFDL